MKFQAKVIILLSIFALLCGCAKVSKGPITRLTVVAPDYLKSVLDRAVAQFYEENNTKINMVYVTADSVIARTKSSLSADLFLTGSPKRFKYLSRDTLLVDSIYSCPFRMSLVLVGRADGPVGDKLEHLKRDEFRRVVLVDPVKGYEGKLAAMVLNRKRLWDKILKKIIMAQSTEHLHSFLDTKEADAAIVFESSIHEFPGLVVMQRLDKEIKDHLIICGAVTPQSDNKEVARAFLDLLDSRLCQIYKIDGIHQYDGRY